MKKIILLVAILTLVSCNGNDGKIIISREEYDRLTQVNREYPKAFHLIGYDDLPTGGDNAILLGSDGHEYLVTNYFMNRETTMHYIECKKCLEERQYQEKVRNTSLDTLR